MDEGSCNPARGLVLDICAACRNVSWWTVRDHFTQDRFRAMVNRLPKYEGATRRCAGCSADVDFDELAFDEVLPFAAANECSSPEALARTNSRVDSMLRTLRRMRTTASESPYRRPSYEESVPEALDVLDRALFAGVRVDDLIARLDGWEELSPEARRTLAEDIHSRGAAAELFSAHSAVSRVRSPSDDVAAAAVIRSASSAVRRYRLFSVRVATWGAAVFWGLSSFSGLLLRTIDYGGPGTAWIAAIALFKACVAAVISGVVPAASLAGFERLHRSPVFWGRTGPMLAATGLGLLLVEIDEELFPSVVGHAHLVALALVLSGLFETILSMRGFNRAWRRASSRSSPEEALAEALEALRRSEQTAGQLMLGASNLIGFALATGDRALAKTGIRAFDPLMKGRRRAVRAFLLNRAFEKIYEGDPDGAAADVQRSRTDQRPEAGVARALIEARRGAFAEVLSAHDVRARALSSGTGLLARLNRNHLTLLRAFAMSKLGSPPEEVNAVLEHREAPAMHEAVIRRYGQWPEMRDFVLRHMGQPTA